VRIAIALMVATVSGGCAGASTPPVSQPPSAAPSVGPTSVPATAIQIPAPSELAVEGSTVWAIAGTDVARIDVATNKVTMLGVSTEELDDLAATPTAIWVADFDGSQVLKIDPATGKVIDRIATGAATGVLPVSGAIWVTNHHEGSVTRIDPKTDKPIGTVVVGKIGVDGPQQLAEGAGSVWVDESNLDEVIRMDPATGAVVAHIPVGEHFSACGGLAATPSAVWVTGCHATTAVIRIDPATNTVVATVNLRGFAADPVIIDGAVWVPIGGDGYIHELVRIDPATNLIDRELPLDALVDIGGSAIAGGDLWIGNFTNAILRVPLSELSTP
jgi:DNA-binding beta-propeller fold protein YncE